MKHRGTWLSAFCATALFTLAAVAAFAQNSYPRDVTLSWINASVYTDGAPIEPGELQAVRIEGRRNSDSVPSITATIPASGVGQAQSSTLTAAIGGPGTYSCVAFTVVIGGVESDPSSPASVKFVGRPSAPSSFTVR